MEQEKNRTLVDKIWDFFASVKFAIVIFALIASTSTIGTILDQKAEPAKNLQILTRLFGESLAPTLYNIFDKLGFMDMYHSWWFTGLLVLFALNLVICSADRLPRIWKLIKEPLVPVTEDKLKNFSINREIAIKGNPDTIKDCIKDALKSTRFRFTEIKEERGYQLYAQKGNYSRLGVYITHLSILIILIGAIIGIRFGFKGYLNLPEGDVSHVAFSGVDKELPLSFEIRCDNFDVEFYGASDMPKEYKSWLTILKDGKEVLRKSIVVNDPLTYEGITFYQSSFGLVPDGLNRGIFIFNVAPAGGQKSTINLRYGDTFQIPGSNFTGKIMNFSPALKIDEQGQASTYANHMDNPAVLIDFFDAGKYKYSGWILKRNPQTWQLPDGPRVEFIDYWGVEFTGLQVRKDPGVWIVYFGCIAMSIGLFIAFFMSHRKIWVKLVEENKNTRVIIGATANKNRTAFERKIDKSISILNKKHQGEK